MTTVRKSGVGLPEPQATHVKAALKKLREAEESNAALARRLALDPATVGRVLGDGAPSIHVANAIAEVLGVEVGEVLEGRAMPRIEAELQKLPFVMKARREGQSD